MKNIFIILLYSTILFGVGIQDWKLLLVIPFSLSLSYFNFKAIELNGINQKFHNIQVIVLYALLGLLFALKVVKLDELFLIISMHYVTFETSLNAFRKLPLNYIGKTAKIDRWIRKVTKTEAMLNQVSSLSKFILLFIGIAIYLTGK